MFGALAPSGHCPRAQPAWGAREQWDICERERQEVKQFQVTRNPGHRETEAPRERNWDILKKKATPHSLG